MALLVQCRKGSITNCALSSGKIGMEYRNMENYSNVLLKDNINLILNSSNNNEIRIEAGENLLIGIETSVNERGYLVLENKNSCDWARSYDTPVNIYINNTNIDTIEYRSIGNISNIDTLVTDTLWVRVMEGAGEINLTADVDRFFCEIHYGTADIIVDGYCNLASVYSASFGLIDLRNLNTDIVYVTNRSSNNIYVHGNVTIGAKITSIGDIYYQGDAHDIWLERTGPGDLIKIQ